MGARTALCVGSFFVPEGYSVTCTRSDRWTFTSSKSNPSVGIVSMRCRGINQRHEVVIEFLRTFMVYKRGAPEVKDTFPETDDDWTV